jgi:hypothetical protein
MVRIQDDRDLVLELVLVELAEIVVAALRHSRALERRGAFLLVIMNLEVRSLEDLPAEVAVLDLVLTELSRGREGPGQEGQ